MSLASANIRCFAEEYPTCNLKLTNAPPLTDTVHPEWRLLLNRPIHAGQDSDTAATSAGQNPFELLQAMPGCTVQPSTANQLTIEKLEIDTALLESLMQHHEMAMPFIDTIKTWHHFKRMFNSEPCVHHEDHNPVNILTTVFQNVSTR